MFPQYRIKWATSSMPFKQMENIAAFLTGVGKVPGIRSFDLFTTVDLFEAKNLEQVKRCLVAWKRVSEKSGVPFFNRQKCGVTFEEFAPVTAEKFAPATHETNAQQESSVSDSGFEASRSTSYHSFEAAEAEEQDAVEEEEEEMADDDGIEICFVEPEIILPPDSPFENNFADIDEPVIECFAE